MTDEYQSIPVAVARAAVQESGLLDGVEGPLFLADNEAEWLPYYIGRYDPAAMPLMAKVIITRQGQKPREVVISWDEYAAELEQNDPAWLEKRKQKPMSIFGAEVERHAYRVVFADVLGKIEAPRPKSTGVYSPQGEQWDPAEKLLHEIFENPARDWAGEVKGADAAKLNGLYDEARDAGALVGIEGLQQAFTDRMLELSAAAKPKPPSGNSGVSSPRPQGQRRRRGKRSS